MSHSSPPRRSRLLTLGLWAGLGLALALIGWLALGACGLGGPGGRPWLAFCPDPAAAADRRAELEAALARERLLEAHLDRLRLALAAAPHCPGPDEAPPQREAGPPREGGAVPGRPGPGAADGPPVDVAEAPEEDGPAIDPDAEAVAPDTGPEAVPEPPLPETPPRPDAEVEAEDGRPEPEGPETPEGAEPPLPPETPETPEVPDTDSQPPTPPAVPEPPPLEDRPDGQRDEGPDTDPDTDPDSDPDTDPDSDRDTGPDTTPPLPPEQPDLPEEVLEEGDIAQLQGCWSLVSPYSIRSRETGETYGTRDWEMCFGPDGSGTQTLTFENGLTCEGPVHAQFDETGNLEVIDLGNVPCEGGRGIDQRITRCERQDGRVDCTTRHMTPPEFPVPVRFERRSP
ncbi:MAG: hypothetical protein GVY13_01995 [Alphaproteobacteria bacterium]|jgi:hypothetical protein|nr:hypothetical protein [Alphaproteobacteria bacterium]